MFAGYVLITKVLAKLLNFISTSGSTSSTSVPSNSLGAYIQELTCQNGEILWALHHVEHGFMQRRCEIFLCIFRERVAF